jgi:hypothetical protein
LKNQFGTRSLAIASLLFVLCGSLSAQKAPRKLTFEEAQGLAFDALDAKSRSLPGLSMGKYVDKNFPDYYAFEALWDNPIPDGSVVVDDIEVDPQTADVWRRGACRLNPPGLAKAQLAIRKKMGLSPKEYQKIRRDGPDC